MKTDMQNLSLHDVLKLAGATAKLAMTHSLIRNTAAWLWAGAVGIGLKYVGSTLMPSCSRRHTKSNQCCFE